MRKLYEKNELTFALGWIAIYVAGTSLAEMLSETIGVYKLVPAAFHIVLTACLFLWVMRNGLAEKYGLFLPRYRLLRAWFFIPLMLVCVYKIVFSPALRFSAAESILFVISMLCVGFLEEIIFRGFLFRAIAKENLTRAVIISSVTFGIGHIVNLFNPSGMGLVLTIGQIVFAVAVGFMLVEVMLKSGSMWPCIIFHIVNNALSTFEDEAAGLALFGTEEMAVAVAVGTGALIAIAYAVYLAKALPDADAAK